MLWVHKNTLITKTYTKYVRKHIITFHDWEGDVDNKYMLHPSTYMHFVRKLKSGGNLIYKKQKNSRYQYIY